MARKLKNFYYTFGTSPSFPFNEGYVIVKGFSREDTAARFMKEYPDEHPDTINCSFIYDEKEWKKDIEKWYKNQKPCAVLSIDD